MTEDSILKLFELTSTHSESFQKQYATITDLSRRLKVAELLIDVLLSDSTNLPSTIAKIETEMENGTTHLLASEAPVDEFGAFRSILIARIEALRTLQHKKL